MIIHIFPDQKFTTEFCKFITSAYSNHYVYIYKDSNASFCEGLNAKNCFFYENIKSLLKHVKKSMKKADTVFIHSLDSLRLCFYLRTHKKILSKAVFVVWGGDVYNDFLIQGNCLVKRASKAIKRFIKNILGKKYVVGHFKRYMTFACSDYEFLQKKYKAKGKAFDCLYPSTISKSELDACRATKKNNVKRIMIGNSATETNNHIEAFHILEQYKKENIEIICPLSYGDNNYRQNVLQAGRMIFGDKFVPIVNYLPPQEYSSLLSTIDVAVFYHDRQQATGNIEILAYYGAKIFLKSSITTWSHYVIRDKRFFYDALTILNMPYETFIRFDDSQKNDNITYFSKVWDLNYIKSKWDAVLNNNE